MSVRREGPPSALQTDVPHSLGGPLHMHMRTLDLGGNSVGESEAHALAVVKESPSLHD